MLDLFLQWNLEIWLPFMGLFFFWGLWLLGKMRFKTTRSRSALENLRSWGKKYPRFSAGRYRRREIDAINSISNPTTQKWLKLFWAGHRQNKPPVVDEVLQREEEDLCSDDEAIRTTSGSLIVLGLLGTFIGLYKVILPIEDIIQNVRNNATITDQSAAAQSMAKMLENISQSLSGMEFAFITSASWQKRLNI